MYVCVSMCTYVYLCVCICIYVYLCVSMCIYVYLCVSMCIYVYLCICMYACVSISTSMSVSILRLHLWYVWCLSQEQKLYRVHKVTCTRIKGTFTRCDKNMRSATKLSCVNGLICATCDCCMVSQESWNHPTFLRQHATVAVAQISPFTQRDFVARRMSHRVNCALRIVTKYHIAQIGLDTPS